MWRESKKGGMDSIEIDPTTRVIREAGKMLHLQGSNGPLCGNLREEWVASTIGPYRDLRSNATFECAACAAVRLEEDVEAPVRHCPLCPPGKNDPLDPKNDDRGGTLLTHLENAHSSDLEW